MGRGRLGRGGGCWTPGGRGGGQVPHSLLWGTHCCPHPHWGLTRDLHILGKHCTTELHPSPLLTFSLAESPQ